MYSCTYTFSLEKMLLVFFLISLLFYCILFIYLLEIWSGSVELHHLQRIKAQNNCLDIIVYECVMQLFFT